MPKGERKKKERWREVSPKRRERRKRRFGESEREFFERRREISRTFERRKS